MHQIVNLCVIECTSSDSGGLQSGIHLSTGWLDDEGVATVSFVFVWSPASSSSTSTKIIDRNFYPKDEENSNLKHRPIGIG
jgi:hypothetical protein